MRIVANINPVFKPITSYQGIAPNQGDQAQNADTLRSTFGLDGTGVKVGVLSDSVNEFEHGLADSVATGYFQAACKCSKMTLPAGEQTKVRDA